MPNKSENQHPLQQLNFLRAIQISESHCGPAVLQMLLGNLGIEVTQEQIAEAGGATKLIALNGMRVDQLAMAAALLAPTAVFWYKEHATLDDLIRLVKDHKLPVGVEWQGLFEDDDDDEEEDEEEDDGDDDEDDDSDAETGDDDYGHYSIVVYVDEKSQNLIIVDPYKDFANQDRIFTFDEFDQRWWDYNEVADAKGRSRYVKDDHMLFIVTTREATFPAELEMKAFE